MYAIVKADDQETYNAAVSHEMIVPHGGGPLMVRCNDATAVYCTVSGAVRVEFMDYPDALVGESGSETPGAEIIDVRA
jgi:hypothetical protein